MRATIVHESRGRMRLRLRQKNHDLPSGGPAGDLAEGPALGPERPLVHERTGCIIVTYTGERETVLSATRRVHLGRGRSVCHPPRSQHPGY